VQYTGQYSDLTTGLYNLRARHHDPAAGRFTSYDPLTAPAAVPYSSDYAYVANRPTVWTDPSGMCWGPEILCPAIEIIQGAGDLGWAAVVGAWNLGRAAERATRDAEYRKALLDTLTDSVSACANDPVGCGQAFLEVYRQCAEAITAGNGDYRTMSRLCIKAALGLTGVGRGIQISAIAARNIATRLAQGIDERGGWKAGLADETGSLGGRRLSPAEQATLARLQALPGFESRTFRASNHPGAEYIDDLGRTYDQLGDPLASRYWNESQFLAAIDKHLLKSNDFTVVDLTGFSSAQVDTVLTYLSELSASSQARLVVIV
jgi:RHS repeat-associated protein